MILTILFVISCFFFLWTTGAFLSKLFNKGSNLVASLMTCSVSFTYIMWYIFTGVAL